MHPLRRGTRVLVRQKGHTDPKGRDVYGHKGSVAAFENGNVWVEMDNEGYSVLIPPEDLRVVLTNTTEH